MSFSSDQRHKDTDGAMEERVMSRAVAAGMDGTYSVAPSFSTARTAPVWFLVSVSRRAFSTPGAVGRVKGHGRGITSGH